MGKWLVWVVVVMLATLASADSESDRNSLKRDIADKVKSIADKMYGFDSRSDESYADDALSYASDVKDLVSRLRDVQEDDSEAQAIVSSYPGYVDTFRDSVRYLKALKHTQFTADGVADRCSHDEADLQSIIRIYLGRPEDAADAPVQLAAKGQELGKVYGPLLDRLKDANTAFASNASYARFDISVSSSDPWSDVRSRYTDSVDRMKSYWNDRFSPVDNACKRLGLGDQHPDVVKAIADLNTYTGNAKQTVRQLKHDFNLWLADARKVREMTDQDHKELRDLICTQGVDEQDITDKVNALADRWASQISSAYGTLLGQADRLTDRATSDKLAKYKGAKEVFDGLNANRATLGKIKSSDLQGSNNPKIKVKMQYGTNYHASWSCSGYKEFPISNSYCNNAIRSGSNCIADCLVTGSTCKIIELKPDNQAAKDMGDKQRVAYEEGLRNWFNTNKDDLLKQFPDVAKCVSDGKLSTDSSLETYKFCPDDSEARAFGEDLSGLSSDVSESD
jgi:hypothetical protein